MTHNRMYEAVAAPRTGGAAWRWGFVMEDRLMERDWRFIVDSLLDVNMAGTVDSCINEMLDLLEYLVPADQLNFNLIEQREDRSIDVTEMRVRGIPADFKDTFINGGYANDPYFYGWNFLKESTAFRDTDMLSDDFREQSATYREIYAPQGVHYVMRMQLIYKQRTVGSIAAFNAKERGDFTERDLYVFNMLAPHFAFKLGQLREVAGTHPERSDIEVAFEGYGLTAREQEIVKYLLAGVPDAELANQLYISTATLKKHVYNIYRKVDVNNRFQLLKLFSDISKA